MAVNTRVLAVSLAAAVVISVGGGYVLSRSSDASDDSSTSVDDAITIASSGTYIEPGIPTNDVVEGNAFPIVDLTDTDGNPISTADLLGQPLVLNVWSPECVPCRKEMPALAKVHADLGDTVRFVGVNALKNTPSALAFAADKGVKYELLSDHNGELQAALGITGYPYTVFVRADGTIVAQKGIEESEAEIRATIAETLLP